MPTTAEYLSDLTSQKSALAETLSNAGVEARASETFDTLVPKVAEATVNVKEYAHNTFSNALKGAVHSTDSPVTVLDLAPTDHELAITLSEIKHYEELGINFTDYTTITPQITLEVGKTYTFGCSMLEASADVYLFLLNDNGSLLDNPLLWSAGSCFDGMSTDITVKNSYATSGDTTKVATFMLVVGSAYPYSASGSAIISDFTIVPQGADGSPDGLAIAVSNGEWQDVYRTDKNGVVSGASTHGASAVTIYNNSRFQLNVEYNRDINKAFAELTQAIISLGGNI